MLLEKERSYGLHALVTALETQMMLYGSGGDALVTAWAWNTDVITVWVGRRVLGVSLRLRIFGASGLAPSALGSSASSRLSSSASSPLRRPRFFCVLAASSKSSPVRRRRVFCVFGVFAVFGIFGVPASSRLRRLHRLGTGPTLLAQWALQCNSRFVGSYHKRGVSVLKA